MRRCLPIRCFAFLGCLTLLSACGVVPKNYQGTFTNPETGATLTLKTSDGHFEDGQGRVIEAKAQSLAYKKLAKGTPGIYLSEVPKLKKLYEAYWVLPDLTSSREEGGLIWMQSEVFFTLFDANQKDPVNQITIGHCDQGRVTLDPQTQRWQIGCPEDAAYLELTRTASFLPSFY